MTRKLKDGFINREFLEDTGLAQQIEEWFTPRRALLTLNNFAGLEPGFRFARAARLESTAIHAATYAIEYRYPMFDRRLMQQYLATPSIEKRHQDMGRYLHRRAMEGRIPESIQWQKSKDVGGYINGALGIETPPDMRHSDLPERLRAILDREPFEQAIAAQREAAGDPSRVDPPRGFHVWQVRQLSAWLAA